MKTIEGPFRATLVTKGRKTGKEHTVTLLAVGHGGRIYFSRHMPNGDWFKNALANPEVKVGYSGFVFSGRARAVEDEDLGRKISELKYPREKRAKEKRVTIEITLDSS